MGACTTERPPEVREQGRGFVQEDAQSTTAANEPLRVLHLSPVGPQQSPREITIVFDRPVTALGNENLSPSGFRLAPQVDGKWRWEGTHAVIFEPKNHAFTPATAFHVQVPSEIRGLDGARLAAPVSFEFETAPPTVTFSGCELEGPVSSDATFRVAFSLATELSEAKRMLAVHTRREEPPDLWRAWPVRVVALDKNPEREFRIVPIRPWPEDQQIRVRFAPGMKSLQSSLPSDTMVETHCRSYAAPYANLSAYGDEETAYDPGTPLSLTFENPPSNPELLRTLRITPNVPFSFSDEGQIWFSGLKPDTRYRVTLPLGLRGSYGGITRTPQRLEFRTAAAKYSPSSAILASPGRIEPTLLGKVAYFAANTRSFRTAGRILTLPEYLSLQTLIHSRYAEATSRLLEPHWKAVPLSPKLPNYLRGLLDPSDWMMPPTMMGPLLIGSQPGETNESNKDDLEANLPRAFLVSDLALTSKFWRNGGAVWVTSLKQQQPLQSVVISLWKDNQETPLGTTDKNGHLSIPAQVMSSLQPVLTAHDSWRAAPVALVARRGSDWSLQLLSNGGEILDGTFLRPPTEIPSMAAFVDRSVYRLGETVYVKGYAHQHKSGWSTPLTERNVTISLTADTSTEALPLLTRHTKTNSYGAFTTQFVLPKTIVGSNLFVVATLEGAEASVPITASPTRAQEFEVRILPPAPFIRGTQAQFRIEGRYHYGAPMARARVKWRFHLGDAEDAPLSQFEYVFNCRTLDNTPGYEAKRFPEITGQGQLADDGTLSIAVPPEFLPATTRELKLTVEVLDAERHAVEAHGSVLAHPARHSVGIKAPNFPLLSEPIEVRALAVDWNRKRVSGREIAISLLRRGAPEPPRESSDFEQESQEGPLIAVDRCVVTSDFRAQTCSLHASQSGNHVVLAESRDADGNITRAADTIHVTEGERSVTPRDMARIFPENEPLPLAPKLDKNNYHIGDTATLSVSSPFDKAWALVTVERDGIYWSETREVERESQFHFGISETMGHNAFVNVLLLRRGGRPSLYLTNNSTAELSFAKGMALLHLAADQRQLTVAISASRSKSRPGEEIRYDFQVTDREGKAWPAELAVWGVDEGVLQLTDFELPNPLARFLTSQPLETVTFDSRRSLAWFEPLDAKPEERFLFRGSPLSTLASAGRESNLGLPQARSRDLSTLFFYPHLIADRRGHAELRTRLPRQLTQLRVMAVATTTGGHFGRGQTRVKSSLPLAMRSLLPRMLRVSDEFDASVAVSADPEVHTTAQVTLEATGVTVLGPHAKYVTLEGGRANVVTFRCRADKPGSAGFHYRVNTERHKDAIAVTLPVKSVNPRTTLALFGETSSVRGERIAKLPRMTGNQGTLNLSLSRTPLVSLNASIEQLRDSTQEGTEQLASHLLMLVSLPSLPQGNGLDSSLRRQAEAKSIVSELRNRQSDNGGFGYWSKQQPSLWLSAYVTWVLHQAGRVGLADTKSLVEFGLRPLRTALAMATSSGATAHNGSVSPVTPHELAFLVDVLSAVAPEENIASAIALLLSRKTRLPAFAQAHLLHAVSLRSQSKGGYGKAQAELLDLLLGNLTLTGDSAYVRFSDGGYGAVLDSKDRTQALVLRAVLAQNSEHTLATKLLRGLLLSRHPQTWSSTQASAWALAAIADFSRYHPLRASSSEDRVWLGSKRLAHFRLDAKRAQQLLTVPWFSDPKEADLVFEHRGNGTLYYAASLTFSPAAQESRPISHGFELVHCISPIDDKGDAMKSAPVSDQLSFPLGQSVQGDLQLFTSSPRHHVRVQAELPAGFEPIDEALTTPDDATQNAPRNPFELTRGRDYQQSIKDDSINYYIERLEPGIARLHYRARATTVGTFTLPPARVVETYAPEQFATTVAGRVTIRAGQL